MLVDNGMKNMKRRTILTRAWTLGSCVKQQCDVGMSISLLATQPMLFEINKICLAFELRQAI